MSNLRIKKVEALPLRLPLKKPVIMASGSVEFAETMLVRIETGNGIVGWGEASSAPTMTGETLGSMTYAVRNLLAPLLLGKDVMDRGHLALRLAGSMHHNNAAKAAIEIALNDAVGRHLGVSVTELYGGAVRSSIEPMYLVGTTTVEGDVNEALACVKAGFRFLKLKCGSRKIADDIAAARAVRDALGFDIRLCADANMGMSFSDAVAYAKCIADLDFEFFEQPFDAEDMQGLVSLSKVSPVPIAGDESIGSLRDILAFQAAGAIGGVNLKTIKCGGLAATSQIATVCNALGLHIKLACKVAESSVGAAALTHLGYTIPNVDWGVSLSNIYLAQDVVVSSLLPQKGCVARPTGPGLGVEINETIVRQYLIE